MQPETERRDNKTRLDPDVIADAELIAKLLGMRSIRPVIEGVFRRYARRYIGEAGLDVPETLRSEIGMEDI